MKKLLMFIILAALLTAAIPCIAGEPVAENSGALTAAKVLATGPGGVVLVVCQGDGSHACGCTLFDNATQGAGPQLPGAFLPATTPLMGGWMNPTPVRFTNGLYASPSANSTCFVSWLQGVR